jgi:type IV pilus assembly protein PilB
MNLNINSIIDNFNISSTDRTVLTHLSEANLLNESELQILLKDWQKNKSDLLSSISAFGFLHEDELEKFILEKFEIQKANFERVLLPDEVFSSLSMEGCKKEGFLPFLLHEGELCIAIRDFLQEENLDIITRHINLPEGIKIKKFYIKKDELLLKINEAFIKLERVAILVKNLNDGVFSVDGKIAKEVVSVKDPIIDLAESILNEAIFLKSSEISLELNEVFLNIRLKIEGSFKVSYKLFNSIGVRLLNRFKILSGVSIAENQNPQNGSFTFLGFDAKVFFSKIAFGEAMSIKISQAFKRALSLEELGIAKSNLAKFIKILEKTSGGIWVAGGEKTGITTTFYAITDFLASKTKKVCVVDAGLEFVSPFSMQFKDDISSALKHEPSVLAINDVKSKEEVATLMRANLEGLKTTASIKANDALSLIAKFCDMGIAKEIISSAVRCIICQKFIKILCEDCKLEIPLKSEELSSLRLSKTDVRHIYKHIGCDKCGKTGYISKSPIFEILIFDAELEEAIVTNMPKRDLQDLIKRKGFTTLFEEARLKVLQGVTDIAEISTIY